MHKIVPLIDYTMTTLQKFVNKKVMLVSAIAVIGIVLSVVILTAPPIGNLWAEQQMITNNTSQSANTPKINGSVNVGEQIKNIFKESTKIQFTTAAETAQEQIANGTVLGGHLGVTHGYLTYIYFVVDAAKETGYKVIVDARNGKVLYTSEGQSMASFGPWKGHGVGPWHGFGGPWKELGSGFQGFWRALFGS
jgi:uncharacterized membrane protein YkoI